MDQNPDSDLEIIEPKVELDFSKLCFICLNDTSVARDCHGYHRPKRQGGGYYSSSVKILSSYILLNSSTSTSSSENLERQELQKNILSSFSRGKSSICSECLSKAESLKELHLELEKVQLQILDALRNLQEFLKTSMGGADIQEDQEKDVDLLRFQDILLQEFMSRELSDGTQVRLERLNNAGYSQKRSSSSVIHVFIKNRNSGNGRAEASDTEPMDVEAHSDDDDYDCDFQQNSDGDTQLNEEIIENADATNSSPGSHNDEDDEDNDDECEICLKTIPTEDMPLHLKTHPEFEKFYKCEECPDTDTESSKLYGTYKGLVWHYLKMKHDVRLPCKLCRGRARSKLYGKMELCKHLYEFHKLKHKRLQCKYENCSSEFYENWSRRSHYIKEHPKIFKCDRDNCGKILKTRWRLQDHKKRVHSNFQRPNSDGKPNQYRCQFCPRVCKTEDGLKKHKMSEHRPPGIKEGGGGGWAPPVLKCPQCSKNISKVKLIQHDEVTREDNSVDHQGEGKFTCDVCRKTFKVKLLLGSCQVERQDKLYSCASCSRGFRTKMGFQFHMKAHHHHHHEDQNPNPSDMDIVVSCKHCSKIFHRNALERHLRDVHLPRPKSMKRKNQDENNETNEVQIYECDTCPMVFEQEKSRDSHRLRKHGGLPVPPSPSSFKVNTRKEGGGKINQVELVDVI